MRALLVMLLAGCAQIETLPEVPKVVKVPYPVPCVESVPTMTFITVPELLALGDAPLVYALAKDRLERINHIGRLEGLLQACVKGNP